MIVKIIFIGNVQGVGFRYRAQEFALELNLTGTVRNLIDGSVELYAQGPQSAINTLQDKLKGHFGHYIQAVDVQVISSHQNFTDFRITR